MNTQTQATNPVTNPVQAQAQQQAQTNVATIHVDGTELGLTTHQQHFRIRPKSDPMYPGMKRDPANFQVATLTEASVQYYAEHHADKLVYILNDVLLSEAKKRFLEHNNDWQYVPQPTDYSLVSIAEDLAAGPKTATRVLTNANLELFANWYREAAKILWGASDQAAENGCKIIQDRFKNHIGKPEFVKVFLDRFSSIEAEVLDSMNETELSVLDALINMLTEASNATVVSIDDI